MKTKSTRIFIIIYTTIIGITLIGLLGTFLSDYLIEINWFGDYYDTSKEANDGTYYHWGARHCWYNWSIVLLVCTSVIRSIVKIVEISEEKY